MSNFNPKKTCPICYGNHFDDEGMCVRCYKEDKFIGEHKHTCKICGSKFIKTPIVKHYTDRGIRKKATVGEIHGCLNCLILDIQDKMNIPIVPKGLTKAQYEDYPPSTYEEENS